MAKVAVITRASGAVSVVNFDWNFPRAEVVILNAANGGKRPETDEEFMERWAAPHARPGDTAVTIVDDSALPADRTFRNAWQRTGAAVTVNMPKARDIHRDYLRQLRGPKLQALDVEITLHFGNVVKQASIEAQRQALRDVTADPAIEAAATPAQLKAVMPAALLA